MEKPILKISQKRFTEESTVTSIRLPKDMLRAFDEAAKLSGRTRNELIAMSLEFALEHMEIENKERGDK